MENVGTSRTKYDENIDRNLAGAISKINNLGVPIFMVTNQPGIAKGQIEHLDVENVQAQFERKLAEQAAFIDDYCYCPHHPDAGFIGEKSELKILCACRKPNIEMYEKLLLDHNLTGATIFSIGDSDVDEKAAQRLNANFIKVTENGYHETARALQKITEKILNDYN
jgi:histidinol-phosphate phosphatase family protein